ncbi:hypothetical protein [Pseudomonas aeruginosa]|uniref:T6SS phospholipase effector Tle1-like catalytic domain-containing protein n=1 Tax=Pseudomonas aeruginosa TaxID=287 RepID=UPI003B3BD004
MTVGDVIDLRLGGTVFLINEEDEAEEYSQSHRDGSARYHQLFSAPDRVAPGSRSITPPTVMPSSSTPQSPL